MITGSTSDNLQKMDAYRASFANYNKVRRKLFRLYFKLFHRLEVMGRENLSEGPGLVVTNHGGGFDLDIVALSDCCFKDRQIHTLIDSEWHFLNHWWGRYWVGSGIPIQTRGGILYEYIDPYLKPGGEHYPSLVSIFAEGNSGTFQNRYLLDKFFPGVVRLALRYKIPIIPTAMIGFRIAVPILKDKYNSHGPNYPIVMIPPIPFKLKIAFGKPFELSEYYGRSLSKAEAFWVANQVVRPKVAEVWSQYEPVTMADVGVEMVEPVISGSDSAD